MRPDYCPIGNEPCQSLCHTPCTVPPKRKPLTDEQIKQIRFDTITELVTMEESELRFARAVEAAHDIK